MTAGTAAATPTGPWTPRVGFSLGVLAAAAFIYVTAEIMPVGALPAIAADLDVSVAVVGTLLASYALVAAVAAGRFMLRAVASIDAAIKAIDASSIQRRSKSIYNSPQETNS